MQCGINKNDNNIIRWYQMYISAVLDKVGHSELYTKEQRIKWKMQNAANAHTIAKTKFDIGKLTKKHKPFEIFIKDESK